MPYIRPFTRNRFRKDDAVIVTTNHSRAKGKLQKIEERGKIVKRSKMKLPGRWYEIITPKWGGTIHENQIVFDD